MVVAAAPSGCQGWSDFQSTSPRSRVVTDSGGIQEQTTYLSMKCVTIGHNTERPITAECGTNILVADAAAKLHSELSKILAGNEKRSTIPPLRDGRASERIALIVPWAARSGAVQLGCDA